MDGLKDKALENWRDIIKIQRHWIGECEGYRVEVEVDVGVAGKGNSNVVEKQGVTPPATLNLWMAHPELIYGITFIGIRPGHALNKEAQRGDCYGDYQMLNIHAKCPLSQRDIPILVSDSLPYIEDTEVYVGIPCVSELDREISKECGFTVPHIIENDRIINSGKLSGLSPEEARLQVTRRLMEEGAGGFPTSVKLKDWLISRQRYWGTPIPIIHCPACGPVPVPEHQLPVLLPNLTHFPKRGISPLQEAHAWLKCSCPK